MDEFVIWGVPGSPYVRAALVGLAEKGARWRLAPLGFRDVKSPAHLERHPFGRMPVLEHGDFRLYELQAILRYLDRIIPAPPFTPTDPRAEARMNQLAGIADWYFMPQVSSAIAFQRMVAPRFGIPVDEAKVAAALPGAEICVAEVARLLGEQSFMAGESLSLADVVLAPQISFLTEFDEGRTLLGRHANLAAWMSRMDARPSMQATTWDRVAQAALRPPDVPGRLEQGLVQQADGGVAVDLLDGGDFPGHAVEGRFVELALGIGLLGLTFRAVQVTDHLGDGDQVAGVDLGLIFLGAAAPHGALDARPALEGGQGLRDHIALGQGPQAGGARLLGGHAQGHFLVVEGDHIDFQRHAGDGLGLDADHHAHAVGGIDDVVANLVVQFDLRAHDLTFLFASAVQRAQILVRRMAPGTGHTLERLSERLPSAPSRPREARTFDGSGDRSAVATSQIC